MSERSEAELLPTSSEWDTVVEAASLAPSETSHECTGPNTSHPQVVRTSEEVPTSGSYPLTLGRDLGLSRSHLSEPCGLQVHEPCAPQTNGQDSGRKANSENTELRREETVTSHQLIGSFPLAATRSREMYGGEIKKENVEPTRMEVCDPTGVDGRCPTVQRNDCCFKSLHHSPAKFLECCLAAEKGARVAFAYPYLKNQPEVFVGGRGPDQYAGDSSGLMEGSSLRIPNNGAQPCGCAMATGGDNNLNVDGSLLSTKIYHGKYGDIRVSDSGIHTEGDCCRICQEDGTYEKLISPCYCSGTVGFMHLSCLETWLGLNGRTACELCLFPFPVIKIQPSIWQFFKRPLINMDFASLLCDIACFCVLTPLLVASTYLCSMGVSHYEEVGKTGSVFAIVTLMVSLIAVYISWAVLAILYHRRVFMTWRERTARIRMWTDKSSSPTPNKAPDMNDDSLSASQAREGSFASRRLSGTSILLKPLLWYSGSLRSQRHPARAPFNQDVNSNRQRSSHSHMERSDFLNKTFLKAQRSRSRQPCACFNSLRPELKLCPFLSKSSIPPLPSCLDVHSQNSSTEDEAQTSVNTNS